MRTTKLELLDSDERVFGSKTAGQYFVREYENGEEIGGSFFLTKEEAELHIKQFESETKNGKA